MILLIGAGGETGRRIIQNARRQGIELRLGARDPDRTRAALGDLADGYQIRHMDAENGASVSAGLEPGDVLLNATTPAGALGHGLARAAIARRAHYTSFTGEILDSLRLKQELDAPARECGVALCPGTGYVPALGDIALRLALRKLPDATDGFTGYAAGGFTPSYGTLLSEMHIMGGPMLILRSRELVQENASGSITRVAGKTLVARPMMDPLMVSTYSTLDNFSSGTQVPEEYATAVSERFAETARSMRRAAGRTAYLKRIASQRNKPVTENEATDRGVVTAFLFRGANAVQVTVSARPIYEQTARCALLVARELDELTERPTGFQAASSIVRSPEYALANMGSTVVCAH